MHDAPTGNDCLMEAGWLTLAVGLPLLIAPWGRNPFELPKALLLWTVVAGMGAVWLAGHTSQVTLGLQDIHLWRPGAWDLLSASCILYLISCLLATLFSVSPLLSAQGSLDRMAGTLTLLCHAALFLWMTDRLRTSAQVGRLLAAISWGSTPVVVYGLLQAVGLDPLGWRVEGSPVTSTLGRSNFLGAYLLLVLPCTLAAAQLTPARRWRVAYLALLAAQLTCLLATRARAAWLGALAAGGVLALLTAWQSGHRRLAIAGATLGATGLLLSLVTWPLLPNLAGSIGARALIWQTTLPLLAARPLWGYGPETFAQVFTAVYPPELVYLQGRAVLVDRAHNLVLDTLASTGLMGLLAYVALVGTALVAGLRAFGRAQGPATRVALAAGLAAATGHLVETQLSFAVTTTATLFWLMLGMLVALSQFPPPLPMMEQEKGRGVGEGRPRQALAALLLLTVCPASLLLLAADACANSSDPAVVRQAVALWPTQPAYHEHLSWLHLQCARRGDNPAAEFLAAEAELDAARRLHPGDYRVWAGYGELYAAWGRFPQAEEAYRQAVALFPGSAMLHTGWGLVYLAQGRLAEAEAQFHQAITLDNTDAWAYRYLGDVLLAQGDPAGAERAYTDALRWVPHMAAAYQGLGHVYRQRGQPELARRAYQRALELSPNDPDACLDLARCLWDLGQPDLACEVVARGLFLAPDHPGLLTLRATCAR